MTKKSELSPFERDLLESVRQATSGEYAAVHTPEQIRTRRRGRPAGSIKANAKVSINLRIDPDVLAQWRAHGKGWQTRAAAVLAAHAP
jgi:uncharacterized protein (DUF4415 family)